MKKIFGLLLAMLMLVSPFMVRAVTADEEEIDIRKYNTLNFREILAQEQIKEDFKEYSETDDQVTIYLFRGNGCGYCQRFLKFMNSITSEYGKYFKIVGFEVWSDQTNSELLGRISEFLGEDAGGVPYVIIGDQVFPGYTDSYNDGIKSAIKTLYDSKDRYDVFEEYNKAVAEAKNAEYRKTFRPVIFNGLFVVIGVAVVIVFVKKQNEKILEAISNQKPVTKVVREEAPRTVERPANKKPANKRRR